MPDQLTFILFVASLLAGSSYLLYLQSGRRNWSPLWLAFGATAAAMLFTITGIIGYTLSRHERFSAGTPWSGTVIWWQIWVGLAAAVVAGFAWRRGLRGIRMQ